MKKRIISSVLAIIVVLATMLMFTACSMKPIVMESTETVQIDTKKDTLDFLKSLISETQKQDNYTVTVKSVNEVSFILQVNGTSVRLEDKTGVRYGYVENGKYMVLTPNAFLEDKEMYDTLLNYPFDISLIESIPENEATFNCDYEEKSTQTIYLGSDKETETISNGKALFTFVYNNHGTIKIEAKTYNGHIVSMDSKIISGGETEGSQMTIQYGNAAFVIPQNN